MNADGFGKTRMLRCASSLVAAAYVKVRLTPRDSRALPAELFPEPPLPVML
jgi:hypothetical protein